MLIYNLISYNIVCNTNTTTNANEIKALTRVESEIIPDLNWNLCTVLFVQYILTWNKRNTCRSPVDTRFDSQEIQF